MTEESRVVHIDDAVEGAVYIGKAVKSRGLERSRWSMDYRPKDYGGRAEAIIAYSYDLADDRLPGISLADLPELRGKPLACMCRHDGADRTTGNSCHGDILVKYLSLYTDEELIAMGRKVAGHE